MVSGPMLAACSKVADEAAPKLKVEEVWRERLIVPYEALPGRARVVGDSVVVVDGTGTETGRVVCFNAADGAKSWVIDGTKPMVVPGVGEGWVCVVGPAFLGLDSKPVQRPTVRVAGGILPVSFAGAPKGATTSGVVGVDVRTGEPVWGYQAPATSTDRTMVTAVAGSVVLATQSVPFGPYFPDRAHPPTTIALDTESGQELWRAADVVGLSGDGDSVVVARRTTGDWLPEVRDARTGQVRWSGTVRLVGAIDHLGTAADHVVLRPHEKGVVVVRLSTGKQLEFDGEDSSPMVMASDPPLLVWDGGDSWWAKGPNGFVTQTLPKGSPTKGKHRHHGVEFHGAYGVGPYLWGKTRTTLSSDPQDAAFEGVVAVDRTGAACSPVLRSAVELADVSRNWLVVSQKGYVEVHRISAA
jgi:outer membrane protein assembly factor BamB